MSDTKDSTSDPMPAPSSVPDKTAEQTSDKMAGLRNAKKRKAQEDRDALSELRKQVSNIADSMSNKPEVVTRPQKEETSSPSMSTEFFRTAVVGMLGLGVFYFNNVWGKRAKLVDTTPTQSANIVAAPTQSANTPAPTQSANTPAPATQSANTALPVPLSPVVPKASPTHFIDLKPKRKIGASGLLE